MHLGTTLDRAVVLCRLDLKAVQQRSLTGNGFMGTQRVNFQTVTTHEPDQRCAAFMPPQGDMCEGGQIVPMVLEVPTLRRNKFRVPRFIGTQRARFRMEDAHEPFQQSGRAVVPRRLDVKAAQQRSLTGNGFMGTQRVNFQTVTTHEPDQRCAAFMPPQGDMCEGGQIVPMVLEVPTLRRNKFRVPRFIGTQRARFRMEDAHEPFQQSGRAVVPRRLDVKAAQQRSPIVNGLQIVSHRRITPFLHLRETRSRDPCRLR